MVNCWYCEQRNWKLFFHAFFLVLFETYITRCWLVIEFEKEIHCNSCTVNLEACIKASFSVDNRKQFSVAEGKRQNLKKVWATMLYPEFAAHVDKV